MDVARRHWAVAVCDLGRRRCWPLSHHGIAATTILECDEIACEVVCAESPSLSRRGCAQCEAAAVWRAVVVRRFWHSRYHAVIIVVAVLKDVSLSCGCV